MQCRAVVYVDLCLVVAREQRCGGRAAAAASPSLLLANALLGDRQRRRPSRVARSVRLCRCRRRQTRTQTRGREREKSKQAARSPSPPPPCRSIVRSARFAVGSSTAAAAATATATAIASAGRCCRRRRRCRASNAPYTKTSIDGAGKAVASTTTRRISTLFASLLERLVLAVRFSTLLAM